MVAPKAEDASMGHSVTSMTLKSCPVVHHQAMADRSAMVHRVIARRLMLQFSTFTTKHLISTGQQ